MSQRALVIGSAVAGLRGTDGDVEAMRSVLEGREFEVVTLTGESATRARILEEYDKLIKDSREEDAAVVFYSGHGGLLVDPDRREDSPLPRSLQFIVPTDYDEDDNEDWRGIASWELSVRLARLTKKTHNATVILDCCHAAEMSRDGAAQGAVVRALPRPHHVGLTRFLEALRKENVRFPDLHGISNPHAVRLVAAGKTQAAYEHDIDGHGYRGVFTESLVAVMDELKDAVVSWEGIARAVQERVLRRFPSQRPDVEGPLHRQPFTTVEVKPGGAVTVGEDKHGIVIRAGRIAGVSRGDVYGLMPAGAEGWDESRSLARLTVVQAGATRSSALAHWRSAAQDVPPGAVAFPLEAAAVVFPVRIAAPPALQEQLVARVGEAPNLCAEVDGDEGEPLAILRAHDGQLTIEDALGPLFPPVPDDEDGRRDVVQNLRNLGVAQALLEMPQSQGLPADAIGVELAAVVDGRPVPLPDGTGALGIGDALCLRLHNRSKRRLHANVFDVGLRRKVTLLSTQAPAGIQLEPGEEYLLGALPDGTPSGFTLSWPPGLPRDLPRGEDVVVIASEQPVDLLETHEQLRAPKRFGATPLQRLFEHVQGEGTRDMQRNDSDTYAMRRLSFHLQPFEAKLAGPTFLVDDNPRARAAADASAAWSPAADLAPRDVEVRLELAITEAGPPALAAGARIDTLVVTRAHGELPVYRAETLRLPAGEAAPLLYRGPACTFVDVFVWIGPDDRGASLRDLLARRAKSPDIRDAVAALRVEADHPEGWLKAAGASALLCRVASELVPPHEHRRGLYRGTFLIRDHVATERRPARDTFKAGGVRFAIRLGG
jgi:hypothetical protein